MINPSKYIRAGIMTTLLPTNVKVWNKRVPKSVTTTPKKYILIINQTMNQYEVSKDCYEYECRFTLDLNNITDIGTDATSVVDDLEQQVRTLLVGLEVPNFKVKNQNFSSIDLDIDTITETINRRLITYTIWLNYVN